jgi:putative tryptophan/tyrosine transport system substrate-binding protein
MKACIRRRDFISLLGGAAATWPLAARTQQSRQLPKLGILSIRASRPIIIETFGNSLREFGYFDGQNIAIEYRSAADRADLLAGLVGELLDLKVDVLVATGSQAVRAAQQATKTVPIVMAASSDPVGSGFIANLARPGGNITGLSLQSPEATGKRLELLKEIVPGISRVAVFWNPDDPPAAASLREVRTAAEVLALQLQVLETRTPGDFDSACRTAMNGGAGAIFLLPAPIMVSQGTHIAGIALKSKLPAIYAFSDFPKSGGLLSYGPNLNDMYRRAAYFVDRILKGAKPSDLPVEQPTKFELVINLKTAQVLGLDVPPTLLARADEVIE